MKARILAPENRKWWTLGAVAVGLFMIMLDNTIVNVALPAIKSDLGIGTSELEWVVTAYALTFAVLLLTGGKLGDLYGRRLIFTIGLVVFTASSLACGLSSTATELIAARAVQGVGSALMMPATLSIITATFVARERGAAIGIWAGVSAMALAIGPLLGGVITEHISWNWIFYVNVPIGLLGVPVPADEHRGRDCRGEADPGADLHREGEAVDEGLRPARAAARRRRGAVGHDGARDRDPERDADLAESVQHAGRHAGLRDRSSAHHGRRHRGHHE